jgi:hypothetical protein
VKGKSKPKKCFCGAIIITDKKVASRQKTCGSKDCQRELKRRNNARWRKSNPDHWLDDYDRVKTWLDAHPGHLKGFRKSHPEYVRKGREAQKCRDRSKRLQLDIHDNTGIKPLELIFLLSLLPGFTDRS